MARPERTECVSFYWTYVDKVPDGDLNGLLADGLAQTEALFGAVEPERETFAYAEGKWTIRELLGHMIDAEHIFGARAFWFARAAPGELPGMDQDQFAEASNAGERPLRELLEEYTALRRFHLALFAGLAPEAWLRRGVASGCEFTVRALAAIMVGHELHHLEVFRERYAARG